MEQENRDQQTTKPSFLERLRNLIEDLKRKKPTFWIFITVIGLIISGTLYGFFGNKFTQWFDKKTSESDKFVAVIITSKSDESFTIPKEFREGYGNDAKFKFFTNNGQEITSITDDDALSETQAELLAKKYVVDEPNCVLIIGNSTSSLTEITLNKILGYKNGIRPAFLLPIATADNITDKAKDQKYNGILRMMPNNESQAITIKNFIFHKFPSKPKVLVYVDEDNLSYSRNLSQKLSDKIIKSKGTVILKKNYGNSNRLVNDFETLKRNNLTPDIIVFVGISTNGSLLMEEMKNLKINIPTIYTDGCTVSSLMEKSKLSSNNFYLSAVQISTSNLYLPTYEPVGKDAFDMAQAILKNVKGKITRESVNAYVESIRKENKILHQGIAGTYTFDDKGENTSMFWKVYGYVDGNLTLVYETN